MAIRRYEDTTIYYIADSDNSLCSWLVNNHRRNHRSDERSARQGGRFLKELPRY